VFTWIVVAIVSARRAPSRHSVSQPGQQAAAMASEL
jgi:hypothetical protein